jgi:hypothetical protein
VEGRATNQSIICKPGFGGRNGEKDGLKCCLKSRHPPLPRHPATPNFKLSLPFCQQFSTPSSTLLASTFTNRSLCRIFNTEAFTFTSNHLKSPTMSQQTIQHPSCLGKNGPKLSSVALGYASTQSSGMALKFL